jgi:hypothetical protein
MNCERAQELILTRDDPASFALGEADLAQHVGGCADCRSLLARLGRIEAAAAGLPPVAEGSEEGLRATLERVRATERTPAPLHRHQFRRPWTLRPAMVGAMAAALLVGVGITALMWPTATPESRQQQAVVEELIDFDQSLAEASPEERERLYAEQAPVLRSAVEKVALSEKDRELAKTVLERPANPPEEDPVARAERLGDLSELIERQLGKAAAANDDLAIQRLGRKFGHVQRGIGAKVADVAPERSLQQVQKLERQEMMQKRLETIRQRQEEARKRLQKLAERSPERAQKILQRMLENERQRPFQGAGKRPAATRPAATQPRVDPNLH